MVSRILGIFLLIGTLMFGGGGMAQAHPGDGNGNWNGNGGSAPELDPSALAGGIAMLVGGVLVLKERRKSK
jgi:hypothetical protein